MTTLRHQLLCIDEGRQLLMLVDTADRDYGWTLDLAELPLARDMQRLDSNRVLIGYDRGFVEIDIRSGKLLRLCERWREVTAVWRAPDQTTRVTGHNLDGGAGHLASAPRVNVLTLDPELHLCATASVAGDYVRLMRDNGAGGYLLCMNDHILETTSTLSPIRKLVAPGFEHAWMPLRLPDGGTLVSAGYGAFLARFDAAGKLVGSFGHAEQLPAEVAPFFYASFQRMNDGRLLVANWQDHGPDNGHKGRQLLAFGPDGQLQGTWSDPDRISSLQGILLL